RQEGGFGSVGSRECVADEEVPGSGVLQSWTRLGTRESDRAAGSIGSDGGDLTRLRVDRFRENRSTLQIAWLLRGRDGSRRTEGIGRHVKVFRCADIERGWNSRDR